LSNFYKIKLYQSLHETLINNFTDLVSTLKNKNHKEFPQNALKIIENIRTEYSKLQVAEEVGSEYSLLNQANLEDVNHVKENKFNNEYSKLREANQEIEKALNKSVVSLELYTDASHHSNALFEECSTNANLNEFNFYREYSRLITARDLNFQFYTEVLNSTEFKEFFIKICSSTCIQSYYKKLGEPYIDALGVQGIFDMFYDSVIQMPFYRHSAGMTFSSMYVFINGNPLFYKIDLTDDQLLAVIFY
jgi:hypothetical protein